MDARSIGSIACVVCARVAIGAAHGREDAIPIPGASVLRAWVRVFADDAFAKLRSAAEPVSADSRHVAKGARAPFENGIVTTSGTRWTARAEDVDDVDAIVVGANVAVVTVDPCAWPFGQVTQDVVEAPGDQDQARHDDHPPGYEYMTHH